jgi:hypothetical protein
MTLTKIAKRAIVLAAVVGASLTPANGGPWAEVGDAQLRSDIEILASAGVIDNITMQWPLPWAGILSRLNDADALNGQPGYVRDAAQRVRNRGYDDARIHKARVSVTVDGTNSANVVRGFDALGRENLQGQASFEYLWKQTAVNVSVGAQTSNHADHQVFVPDGSYLAQRIGNAVVYAGYKSHWWGPGWVSSMVLSNNARPMPQIGIARVDTLPFKSPWLSWLGPWQMEFFVGILDGPRIARNTVYDGVRLGFSPLPHLEIGLARTDQMCGTGHPCKPIKGYFDLSNQNNDVNIVNDQGSIDVRYSGTFDKWAYAVYAQAMNEDTNPIVHSGTSHLFGASAWLPFSIGVGRLTVEYADSVATRDLWGGSVFHGFSYNNWSYQDGMRYRGRTLGFSLDSDSRLWSAQASLRDRHGVSYTLTYHRAEISSSEINIDDPAWHNVVTTAPVSINLVQTRVDIPLHVSKQNVRLSVEGRLQDDQPRPNMGALATLEVAVTSSL